MSKIKDGWVIAFLVFLSAGIAFWAAQQAPACEQESAHNLWDAMPWALKIGIGQLAVAGGLMLWTLSRRFIPPVPYTAEQKRSRGEYLHSIAQLWRRAGASGLALQQLALGFRRDLTARLGVPGNAETDTLVRAAKQRWPEKADELEGLLDEIQNAKTHTDDARLRDLAHRLARFRREIQR